MEDAVLKEDLIDKIEHADHKQLKEIYGLITNYFIENDDSADGWDSLTEYHKQRITESIEQADAGLGIPAKDVIRQAREKFGLNG